MERKHRKSLGSNKTLPGLNDRKFNKTDEVSKMSKKQLYCEKIDLHNNI